MSAAVPLYPPLSRKVARQAVEWYLLEQSGQATSDDLTASAQWRARDPEHARAWSKVQQVGQTASLLPPELAVPVLRRPQRRVAVQVLLALMAAPAAWLLVRHDLLADYRSGVGERREVSLPDGGTLVLNTDSAVDVAYSATQRRIRLHHGEIMITTAPDARPFLVNTPHGVIRALGTRFGVRCDDGGSVVSVFEHAVEVRCAARPDAVRRLEAGQQLRFQDSGPETAMAMPAHQDSWLRGMLVAADWPLQQLVQELARYRRGRLVCDAAVAQRPVTGTYRLDDIDAVLESLCASHGLQVTYFTRYWATVSAGAT